ncbi:MAG: hypothetical protein ACE5EF_00055 [Dehalococcoidia bacterium]
MAPTLRQQLEEWKFRVHLAREQRQKEIPLWNEILDFYRSEPPTPYPEDSLRLQVNWVYSYVETMLPQLTFRAPHFRCRALSENAEQSSRTTEAAVNGELKRAGIKRVVDSVALDGLLLGVGIYQLGYYRSGLVPDVDTPPPQEEPFAKSRSSDRPYGFDEDSIYVQHVRPDRFLIDPNATGLDDALWCGVEIVRPVELVKKDPQYQNTESLAGDEAILPVGMELDEYRTRFEREPEPEHVRLIQIWDIVKRKTHTFVMGHDRFLQTRRWTLPVKRFPFYAFHATCDEFRFWNQSPVATFLSLVNEYNLTVSNRVDHLSRNNSKIAFNKSVLDEAEMENFLNTRNLAMVGLDIDPGDDVRKHVAPIQSAQLPQDQWAHTAEIRQRITEISGVSEFDVGGTRPGERSATEIQRIAGGGDVRRYALASRLLASLESLAHDVRATMQTFYTKERVVEITDDFGGTEWVKYSGSNLHGDYAFACSVEELAPMTLQEREQRAGVMLQMLTPYSQVGSPLPRLDIDPVLKHVGEELHLTPYLRFFPSQQPPQTPEQEWYAIVDRKMDLDAHELDDHDFHVFTHQLQMDHPLTLRNVEARERLAAHIERHEARKLQAQIQQQGAQKAQQAQQKQAPGSPGPPPGQTNNPSGGAGPFSGSPTQQVSGGADVSNLQALLRSGAAQ